MLCDSTCILLFPQHRFYFDHVFGEESTNEEVYKRTAYPLVQHMLHRYGHIYICAVVVAALIHLSISINAMCLHRGSATCFAYGQTGAGKTHTMLGSSPSSPGLYTLAVRDIFAHLSNPQFRPTLLVFVSFFEIYCGQLYDLLDGRKRCVFAPMIFFLTFLSSSYSKELPSSYKVVS